MTPTVDPALTGTPHVDFDVVVDVDVVVITSATIARHQ
jgi:hypothetical protein